MPSTSMSTERDLSRICEYHVRLYMNDLILFNSGMNSIFMYDIAENGTATPLSINLSPTEGDGPRNSYPSKDGKLLYVVG